MESSEQIYENLKGTFEKYKKNKTLVSPEDLKGKYKVPFENLKKQLAKELSDYLIAYSMKDLTLVQDEHLEEFSAAVDRIIKATNVEKRIGEAAFKEFDLDKVERIAVKLKIDIHDEAWVPYFHKHTCLYITPECLALDNPQTPRIYNSLVDMFWDEKAKEWIKEKTT